jgi:tryptophanyl-tRNA synthetase
MLSGLKEGQEKMSKSDPDSAIFMEDTAGGDYDDDEDDEVLC